MFYFSHACDCRFQLKSDDLGYSFCTSILPSNLSNAVRALKKGEKSRGGKASKYNQDCLCQWALQKDSVFMWLSQWVGLQCSFMLCIPYCSYFKGLFFFSKALNIHIKSLIINSVVEIEVLKLTDSVKSIFTVRRRIRFHVMPPNLTSRTVHLPHCDKCSCVWV